MSIVYILRNERKERRMRKLKKRKKKRERQIIELFLLLSQTKQISLAGNYLN